MATQTMAAQTMAAIDAEVIGKGRGKRAPRRVVSTEPMRVEVSFEEMSSLLGVEGVNIGTYLSHTKPDGSLSGEGQGVFASPQGEMLTWKGTGCGRYSADGSVHYRGTLDMTSSTPKLATLNATPVLFEFTVDAEGNTSSKLLAWR